MKQYFLVSFTVMAMFLARYPAWHFTPHYTIYTYAPGDTVAVYDSTLIDSLQLRGWRDIRVAYPININDSNDVHIVYLADSEVVR